MKKTNNRLFLFFTNKAYRWSVFFALKLRIITVPVIYELIWKWKIAKFVWKTRKISNWDWYMEVKSRENQLKQSSFIALLLCLLSLIMAEENREDEAFLIWKQKCLDSEFLNETPELAEFKMWLESIDPSERDTEPIRKVLEKYQKP